MSSTPYRIAIITDALGDPPRNGRELPIYELARALSRRHRVDLVLTGAPDTGSAPPFFESTHSLPFRTAGRVRSAFNEVVGGVPAFTLTEPDGRAATQALEELCREPYDLAWCSPVGTLGVMEWCRRRGLTLARSVALGLNDVKTTMHVDAIRELISGRYGLDARRIRKAFRLPLIWRGERKYLRAVDLTHVQTSKEADKLHAVTVGMGRKPRVVVAPNGIKEELLALPSRGTPEKRILYMTHLAGGRASESRWFVDRVWPRIRNGCPQAELWIVGTPPAAGDAYWTDPPEGVELKGFVDDLPDLFGKVGMAVVPILHSTGLINRLLDVMAAGLPVVTSQEAMSTVEGARDGQHVLCASSAEGFAETVLRLLSDPALGDSLSTRARELAGSWPTWQETTSELVGAVEGTIQTAPRRA